MIVWLDSMTLDFPSLSSVTLVLIALAIEPIINAGSKKCRTLRDGWTVVTEDGGLSAQWEHTVLVTNKGNEILTDRG